MDSVRTKNLPGTWETLSEASPSNCAWESITVHGFERESDEPIVVMKWGNAHGAKGFCSDTFKIDMPRS